MNITVLGAGAWGTAIASLLADNGHTVMLWCYEAEVADTISRTRINERYLPGYKLATSINVTTDLKEAFAHSTLIFQAIPVKFIRAILKQAASYNTADHQWISLSKGIEEATLLLPTQIIEQVCRQPLKIAVVAGPSFATEIVAKQVTGIDIASNDVHLLEQVKIVLENRYFKAYSVHDLIGVQLAAALKNVLALGVGILDGAGYQDNTKAFFLTKGLQEVATIIAQHGGHKETVYGLSGVGDTILTCMGRSSKNRAFGQKIGKGTSLVDLQRNYTALPEGVNTLHSLHKMMKEMAAPLPILRGIYEVVIGQEEAGVLIAGLAK